MRNELELFASAMEAKLQRHDKERKDSWKECDVNYLLDRLEDESDEFHVTVSRFKNGAGYDRKELVDIANFCMMLWNRDLESSFGDTNKD